MDRDASPSPDAASTPSGDQPPTDATEPTGIDLATLGLIVFFLAVIAVVGALLLVQNLV